MNGNVKAAPGDEWFDVVNESDEVVGRERRAVVHARGLLHRAVHVFVFNAAGQLFLQKRSMAKDMAPGLWDTSCAGHLDAGEDYDAAAWRELAEELGCRLPNPPARWRRFEACADLGWEFVWTYRVQAEGPFELHPGEIERGEWLTLTEVDQAVATRPSEFSPAFCLIWSRLREELVATGAGA